MNLNRILKSAVRVVKQNPDKVLIVAAVVAPGLAVKAAPIVAALGRKG